ncbi:hypothetical protein EXIGLDRAFT_828759 [Exidia glandulosa HHB12029]|uniref:AhpC-TSA-domain-containing protein n=1 Tax=Exidia glandulosa HHB12029 TaxID=1314781 RepID=A0A165Q259_EXIGL|nr:hypothetical protein EXIGLDRAFT_828759 [Exidia glandulosa HHB12029]
MPPPATDPTTLVTTAELESASALPVLDAEGKSIPFGSLFENGRAVVVLIRHFWCGSCQDYVCQLASVPSSAFEAAGVRLVVIGCGDPTMIKNYKELTQFHGEMYADPTRKLYDVLGATSNLGQADKKPSYIQHGFFYNAVRSLWRGFITQPTTLGKQGKFSQLGADLVLGPGNTCTFSYRMRNTQDHIEVQELMKHAGVEYTP